MSFTDAAREPEFSAIYLITIAFELHCADIDTPEIHFISFYEGYDAGQ